MPMFENRIRFGVTMGQQDLSLSTHVDRWKAAESLGYDWASVYDHFVSMDQDPGGPCFEGMTLLAGLAVQTSRIRCGMLVIGNTYRHPAVLAKEAVTIDHLSGGRLELGIGAGWHEMEHQAYGIEAAYGWAADSNVGRGGQNSKKHVDGASHYFPGTLLHPHGRAM